MRLRSFIPAGCLLFAAASASAQANKESEFLNINPSWSPDGVRLVFESRRHGGTELYIINADGTGERRLTFSGAAVENTHPSWSADGSTIVFDSNREGAWTLYAIRADGTGERRVMDPAGSASGEFARHPEWSPDGRWIAFDSKRDGNGELYVVRPDGTGLRRITDSPNNDSHPSWTPDGEVVVVQVRDGERSLGSAHPESGRVRSLFDPPRHYSGALLSPDRRRVLYLSTADSTPRLFVATLEGTEPARAITPQGSTSYEAAWSPDGTRIAFYHDRTGKHELYIVEADGSGARQITGRAVGNPAPR
jgi:TolB protein